MGCDEKYDHLLYNAGQALGMIKREIERLHETLGHRSKIQDYLLDIINDDHRFGLILEEYRERVEEVERLLDAKKL